MRLVPHPSATEPAVDSLDAEARRDGAALVFEFRLRGRVNVVRLAPAGWPERTDGLWETTCFEAFVRAPGASSYAEFNFAPSTRWAAYRFDAYRGGMAPLAMETPRIVTRRTDDTFSIAATVEGGGLPPGPLRLALTAVIETADGAKSYWSLAHPPGKPDFHAEAGFVYDVSA